jgi:hypothetical protein
MDKRKRLVEYLKNRKANDDVQIAHFREQLAENPAHAFEWSLESIEAAARIRVYTYVMKLLEEYAASETTLEKLHDWAAEEVRRRSHNPKRSTSPVSNLIDQEVTAAWAGFLETVEGFIKAKD